MYFIALFYCKLGDTIIREDINSRIEIIRQLFIYLCYIVPMYLCENVPPVKAPVKTRRIRNIPGLYVKHH